jgi:predicted flap endonuclease-1-like 5' DNA nuclease
MPLEWIKGLLGLGKPAVTPGEPRSFPSGVVTAEEGRRRQLAAFGEAGSVLAGVRWAASMSLFTSLRSLEHHGEMFRGDPTEAPMYGDPSEGIWVPVVSYEGVGLRAPEEGTMWTPIGEQVTADGGDLLPFLLAFRRIVESDLAVPEKLAAIESLCESTAENRGVAQKIRASRDSGQRLGGEDFARKFLAKALEEIPGLGPATALRLFDAGFHTVADLAEASDADLLKVPKVGPAVVSKIRQHQPA